MSKNGPTLALSSLFRAATATFLATMMGAGNVQAQSSMQVKSLIAQEARASGRVPVNLAMAVAGVESNYNPKATSPAGAQGVMQIMPSTARIEFDVSADKLKDPELNIRLGIAYLERLHNRYGGSWELALSHYNGGTLSRDVNGRYQAHTHNRAYVERIIRRWVELEQGQDLGDAGATIISRRSEKPLKEVRPSGARVSGNAITWQQHVRMPVRNPASEPSMLSTKKRRFSYAPYGR